MFSPERCKGVGALFDAETHLEVTNHRRIPVPQAGG